MSTVSRIIVRPSVPASPPVPHNPLRRRGDQPLRPRADRIERARQRIATGYYDRHEALLDLLLIRMLPDLADEE